LLTSKRALRKLDDEKKSDDCDNNVWLCFGNLFISMNQQQACKALDKGIFFF
jgi:hypothetical protein